MLYPTATDHINKQTYSVLVPPHVMGIHKLVMEGVLFAPIYEAFDHNQPQTTKATIADMVSYVVSKTTFTIIDDYEVLVILHQIDAYVAEVYPLSTDPTISSYIEKILRLRSRVYSVFRKVLNRHPQWKTAYSDDGDVFSVITRLYQTIGISADAPQNLLEELVVCPTIRNNTKHLDAATKKTTGQRLIYNV